MLEQTKKQVKVIKPTAQNNGQRDLRVAAYCRVSTDSEDQSNSFLTQVKYYTDFISNSANMVLVDIYADEGITGTCVNKRDEFLRMIKDCKIGKIDKIFVKSVSRFARNSLECIENIRILKESNVTVVFENDGIDTESMNSEMILYIKSAFAQSEALAGSKRVTTATRMRMQSGEFNTFPAPYGYKIENNKLVPVLELQPIIEKIFRDYLSGKGQGKIAEELNAIEDTGRVWNKTAIKYILYNEKYVGDSLLQKTYTPQVFPLRNKPNRGEVDKYYVSDTHEPLISRELYDAVQRKLKKNQIKKQSSKPKSEKLFSNIIKCGCCGWAYKQRTQVGIKYWVCSQDGVAGHKCDTFNLRENDIKKAFVNMYNRIKQNESDIIDFSLSILMQAKSKVSSGNLEIQDIDTEIAKLSNENNLYVKLKAKNIMDEVSFMEQTADIQNRLTELRTRRTKLLNADEDEQCIEQLRELKSILDETGYILKFSDELFLRVVKAIHVQTNGYILFELKCGLKLKERAKWE